MVNKVILIGNVGLDPEVRTTEGGVKVARVRLATTERLFDRASNETKEHTEWHTITLWRGLADVVGACAPANGWTRTTTNAIRPKFWPTR